MKRTKFSVYAVIGHDQDPSDIPNLDRLFATKNAARAARNQLNRPPAIHAWARLGPNAGDELARQLNAPPPENLAQPYRVIRVNIEIVDDLDP